MLFDGYSGGRSLTFSTRGADCYVVQGQGADCSVVQGPEVSSVLAVDDEACGWEVMAELPDVSRLARYRSVSQSVHLSLSISVIYHTQPNIVRMR